ncbi:MAG: hypothetical protein H7099_09120 [Gemmatimonadaceae bacterium]|nr:hypothetical protein [Gemmatimonadaceae bacterium]
MRTVRLAFLLVAAAVLTTACEKTVDSPGKGDTAVPYGGAGANGSIGSTPGYLNAAGADKAPKATVPAAAAATDSSIPPAAAAADTGTRTPAKH